MKYLIGMIITLLIGYSPAQAAEGTIYVAAHCPKPRDPQAPPGFMCGKYGVSPIFYSLADCDGWISANGLNSPELDSFCIKKTISVWERAHEGE